MNSWWQSSTKIQPLTGALVSLALLWVMASSAGAGLSLALSGIAFWGAVLLLWPRLARRNRIQSLVLLLAGFLAMGFGAYRGANLSLETLLAGNSGLISMLVAVSFLALISRPEEEAKEQLPQGKRAIGSSLLAVHLFGAVINLSSIFIIGDRISRRLKLSRIQVLVLVRGFSAAAFWSPFFAAMAVALSYAPNASLPKLWLAGMPLAVAALIITYWQMSRDGEEPASEFTGYPMHYGGLWLPLLLAALVFASRAFYPSMSVLALITLLSPLLAILVLAVRRERVLNQLMTHSSQRLPQMGNELTLFQAAGVLGYGLERLASTLVDQFPLQQFGALEACVAYAGIVLLAVAGVHPIISISLVGALLAPLNPDHTLLALVFLSAWSLGSVVGPLSGMNLAIQGRYGIDSFRIMRWNLFYTAAMSVLVMIGLWGIAVIKV
ncbi:hypothetical protein MIB92_13250 [Aestuariirhabdus sp. Z084]|uniref:hypothetical protein n=1 Tax=Aestuariirhabdus haliotis TaxID=2918751 RepID=UPI00201B3DB9|nr:hypothetical protein [Aestuariirhabdus haliotis]MCL6416620.1 hypothetical protein [Aestuariirhabdus haliotis]MCL6420655.1 hypothetical protein [Aestuariirhabdus haliotis]